MISESRYSWGAVSVFGIPLCSWVFAGGTKWEFATTWKLGLRTKISRKPDVSSLIDLILAMAVLFSDMTLTLHKSWFHCCGVIQFWACSSLMSVTLPPEAGCETWVCIVLKWAYWVTVIWQQKFTSCGCSRRLATCDCWRHLWQVTQRDNDCW